MVAALDQDQIREVFRQNLALADKLKVTINEHAEEIKDRENVETIKIMNFCGTHEWTTTRYGIRSLLPPFLDLVAGPGCPVCVTPASYVDAAVKLALEGVRIYTYGDVLKLRGSSLSYPANLEEAKSCGGEVRVVYSYLDAISEARRTGRESVFFAIGFETTVPSYALSFRAGLVPENLKFLNAIRLTPPAMKYTIKVHQDRGLLPIRGIIAPGHVSAIIGASAWDFLPREHHLPTVVAGFEPIDVLMAVAQILLMLKEKRAETRIEYKRLVRWEGNVYAKDAIASIFERTDAVWRGLGTIPQSGLRLKGELFEKFDALKCFGIPETRFETDLQAKTGDDLPSGCKCGEVVVGISKPVDCPLFMKGCSPAKPWGPCMVSSEGTCNVWARQGAGGLTVETRRGG
ncbi:MAG: hydrogenase formation protein HypD [Candidatus Hadarchaeum sp.]|uniref:hydrogenase formation protein HypD n=1 Tax=Candidatus Hadarchaeum sp. TaxID=2883567 RepID=UPI003D09CD13